MTTVDVRTMMAWLRQRRPWWERARDRDRGVSEVPRGRGGDVDLAQVSRGAGGKQVAPWRAHARRRHLCACLARTKQLAGMGQHSAGPLEELGQAGKSGKWLGFSLFLNFCPVFFYLIFCHCFEFKIIQTMPKTPLNIFILLDGLFQSS